MLKKLKENRGEFVLDSAIGILIGAVSLVLVLSVFGAVFKANKLSVMAADLTRYIELCGEVNYSNISIELARLSSAAGLENVTAAVDTVYTGGGNRIQFGDSFTVTLNYTDYLQVGNVLSIPLPFHQSVVGRSEKYWK